MPSSTPSASAGRTYWAGRWSGTIAQGSDHGIPSRSPGAGRTKTAQSGAVADWWDGTDPTGHKITRISVPTLIADDTDDRLDPVANDHTLARLIPGARLVLYPDAGHALPVPGRNALRFPRRARS